MSENATNIPSASLIHPKFLLGLTQEEWEKQCGIKKPTRFYEARRRILNAWRALRGESDY